MSIVKTSVVLIAAMLACCSFAVDVPVSPEGVATAGAEPGAWTQDWDAARAAAAAKGLPLLLRFASSDVPSSASAAIQDSLASSEWQDWASTNLYEVFLDFPETAKTVPDAWKARNAKLRETFSVSKLPAFVLVSPEGEKIGSFSSADAASAASLLRSVRVALLDADPEARRKILSAAQADEYDQILARIADAKGLVEKALEKLNAASDANAKGAALTPLALAYRTAQRAAAEAEKSLLPRLEEIRDLMLK